VQVARRTLATICVKVATRFDGFVERKTREAESARIYQLLTEGEGVAAAPLATIGNDWTRALYDGGFHLSDSPQTVPSINLVFVQSSDGNTGAANPATLGGGPTDLHLIIALSRLRIEHGINRISAIGGRRTASSLIDAGVVEDLC
jgi:hypothetical protein